MIIVHALIDILVALDLEAADDPGRAVDGDGNASMADAFGRRARVRFWVRFGCRFSLGLPIGFRRQRSFRLGLRIGLRRGVGAGIGACITGTWPG